VKTYVSALFRKLGLKQRTAAAAYAARIFNGPALEPGQNMWITDQTPRNLTRASPRLRRRGA